MLYRIQTVVKKDTLVRFRSERQRVKKMESVTQSDAVVDVVGDAKAKKRQRSASQKQKSKVKEEQLTKVKEDGSGPKKWRQRTRRCPPTSAAAAQSPSTFQLFGADVEYRVCGTIVMFKTEHILSLTKMSLGLKTDVAKSTPVGAILRHLRAASKYELLLQVRRIHKSRVLLN